jgi:D-amino peptidase
MRVLISGDMEGITGVTCPDDVEPGTPQWDYHRVLYTADVNAAVRGLFTAGAESVLVNDGHANKRNLVLDQLDERAALLIGTHKPLGMMQGLDTGPDAVVFLGYHTGAGLPGVLSHTYLGHSITGVWLDGIRADEGRLNAALAAEFSVPLAMVTGDDRTVAEAAQYAPHAVGVAVKTCVDRYSAICLPPAKTVALIEEGAEKCLTALPPTTPASGPHELVVEFDGTHFLNATTAIPGVEAIGERTIRFELPTMLRLMRCFKVVATVAYDSIEAEFG